MLLTAKLAYTKLCKNPEKPLKPLANGYSSESAQQELSNEHQHDRVLMDSKNLCILVLWAKVATALEGLNAICACSHWLSTWTEAKGKTSNIEIYFYLLYLGSHI